MPKLNATARSRFYRLVGLALVGDGKAARRGYEVTALHNHLLRNTPFTMYMHVAGHGDPIKRAAALRAGLAESKTPMTAAAPPATPPQIDLDTAALDQILGAKGNNNGGGLRLRYPQGRADQ
jgi:hypothetical protein